jgi:aspartate racemase
VATGGRQRKIIGIIGGMGPAATADLFTKITRATAADGDRDHLRVLVDSNPAIPDRTDAILSGGEDPGPALIETARALETAGAKIIVIPCNTAHWYLESIRNSISVSVLDMIGETASLLAATSGIAVIGLLATSGTLATGLYARALNRVGLACIEPAVAQQDRLMWAIKLVKAGREDQARALALEVAEQLIGRGAQVIVLGCTELPLIVTAQDLAVSVVDPTTVLARAAVLAAGGTLTPTAAPYLS